MLLGDGGAWAEGPPLQGVPSQPPAPLHHHPDSRDPECFSVFLESIRKTGPGGQQAPTGRPSLFLLRPGQSRPPSSAPLLLPGPLNSDQGPPLPAVGPGVSSKRPNGPRALVGTPPDLALPASGVRQLEGCQAASPAQGVASSGLADGGGRLRSVPGRPSSRAQPSNKTALCSPAPRHHGLWQEDSVGGDRHAGGWQP